MVELESSKKYGLIVIGASSGGMQAVMQIVAGLKETFVIPVVIVLHQLKNSKGRLVGILQSKTKIPVVEPLDKEEIRESTIYVAPPDYHLLIGGNRLFGYSYSEAINYSRPSIDVLFETASLAFRANLAGVLLTGANEDGAKGMQCIGINKGLTLVEDPATAEMPVMPRAAIELREPDKIITLNEISKQLNKLEYGI